MSPCTYSCCVQLKDTLLTTKQAVLGGEGMKITDICCLPLVDMFCVVSACIGTMKYWLTPNGYNVLQNNWRNRKLLIMAWHLF